MRAIAENKSIGRFYWIGALALALGVRLYLFTRYYTINNDGVLYIEAARHFWEGRWGEGMASFYPPLFPLMIAGVYPLLGDWEFAGQFWPLLLSLLMLLPLFGLLSRIYGQRVARVALLFYGVSPYVARLSLEVRTEIPYTFFLVLSLYLLQRGLDDRKLLLLFLMGVISALAYLVRPEGAGLLIVGVSLLLYRRWIAERSERIALKVSVLILGFVIFSAPYLLYLRWDTGEWAISRKTGLVFSMALARQGWNRDESAAGDSSQVRITDFVASHPLSYLNKVFADSLRSLGFYFEALHYSYLPFLFAGWFLFFRGRFWEKGDFLFLVVVVFYLGTFALIYVTRRYGVPLVPLSLGWVASGYIFLVDRLGNFVRSRHRSYWVGALLALFVAGTLPKTLQAIGWDKFYLRQAGAYLKAKAGATIATNNGRVAFYAEGENRVRLVNAEDLPVLLGKGADYLALDEAGLRLTGRSLAEHGWLVEKEFSYERKERLVIFRKAGSG
ncbi:MAG: glycosyltransferase family 39 protein [Deltaproteobacteria bacterium]|nr:glycosyltransferase family 39 protein [Deltaproteobacteria bacterium]